MNYLYEVIPVERCREYPIEHLAEIYLDVNNGHYPDALWDGNNLREKRADFRLNDLATLDRLRIVTPEGMQTITILLGYDGELYSRALRAEAKNEIALLVGDTPSFAKIERGKSGLFHVHLLTSTKVFVSRHYSAPIYDLEGFVGYVLKPSDSRAAYWKDPVTGFHYAPTEEMKVAALECYLQARIEAKLAHRRLAAMTITHKIPQSKSIMA